MPNVAKMVEAPGVPKGAPGVPKGCPRVFKMCSKDGTIGEGGKPKVDASKVPTRRLPDILFHMNMFIYIYASPASGGSQNFLMRRRSER